MERSLKNTVKTIRSSLTWTKSPVSSLELSFSWIPRILAFAPASVQPESCCGGSEKLGWRTLWRSSPTTDFFFLPSVFVGGGCSSRVCVRACMCVCACVACDAWWNDTPPPPCPSVNCVIVIASSHSCPLDRAMGPMRAPVAFHSWRGRGVFLPAAGSRWTRASELLGATRTRCGWNHVQSAKNMSDGSRVAWAKVGRSHAPGSDSKSAAASGAPPPLSWLVFGWQQNTNQMRLSTLLDHVAKY